MSVDDKKKKQADVLDANINKNHLASQKNNEIELPQQKWESTAKEVEKIVDAIGNPIEEGIKDTIVALNIHNINTSGSCEGHIDWGTGAPWIQIEAPNQPEENYNNEKNILEKIARENNITVNELRKEDEYENIFRRAMQESKKNGETEEAIKWQAENEKLRLAVEETVNDFYRNRSTNDGVRIKFRGIGGWETFRIYSGTEEDYDRDSEKMNDEEKEALGRRLEEYQKEIKDFTEFLKDKFFTEGEGYIRGIMKNVQEETDAKKLDKIREKL